MNVMARYFILRDVARQLMTVRMKVLSTLPIPLTCLALQTRIRSRTRHLLLSCDRLFCQET